MMNRRISQEQSRPEDNSVSTEDTPECCPISKEEKIPDVGAGTVGLTLVLRQVSGISLTAVKPSPEMLL